jgi:demethylspheroidene O-methyltransferase
MSLRDRLLAFRDSVISNPGFQRFAAQFPLMRPVARRRAGVMFDLCAGFVYSQILLACVRLRLLDELARGPVGAAELATRLALPLESMQLLLDAAVALELAQPRSRDRYGLGLLGAELCGNPGVTAMIEHHAFLYNDLRDPVALLRGQTGSGELSGYWPYANAASPAKLSGEEVAAYTALMSASQPMVAQCVLHTYSFRAHRCLLDVGGGDGAFVSAVAAQAPQLRCMLFDLPAVAEKATARFQADGLSSRAVATGGSFLTDPLPQGADVISLVRVIHDHDDDTVMTLLRAARAALPDDGTLVVAEPMIGGGGAENFGAAYFSFYLLAMGSGKPRTFARISEMLVEAGFCGIKLLPSSMPLVTSVISSSTAPRMC